MENKFENRIDLTEMSEKMQQVKEQISSIIIGQQAFVDLLLVALLADGHVLIEGVPGVAKTLTAKLMAKTIDADFKRVQFTPDLMPGDILGTTVFNAKSGDFDFRRGPLFANLVLADEINRSPAKTQSALFEAMEERQITIDGTTYVLDEPFMVMATQNPVEQEGTYRLPEAQLDRFLFKINVDYPSLENESRMLSNYHQGNNRVDLGRIRPVLDRQQIRKLKDLVGLVVVESHLLHYIVEIVHATRKNPSLFLGASPRASMSILAAAKAHACLNNRDFVTPDDIKWVATPVLRHRVLLTPEKEMEGIQADTVIQQIIDRIQIPQ